jgi:endoglucanase Acf2
MIKLHKFLVLLTILISSSFTLQAHEQSGVDSLMTVGKGSYTLELRPEDVTIDSRPKISAQFQGKLSTNDWMTSLSVDSSTNPHSFTMYPHPLAIKTQSEGVQIGYPNRSTGGEKDYRFVGSKDMVVGPYKCTHSKSFLSHVSDGLAQASWEDAFSLCPFQASFGHGMPFVYFRAQGSKQDFFFQFYQDNIQSIGNPFGPLVYQIDQLDGTYNSALGNADFELLADASNVVGNTIQMRLSYDFTGDGIWDKIETRTFFSLDPVPGKFERYKGSTHPIDSKYSSGNYDSFKKGSLKIEVWKPFGKSYVDFQIKDSYVKLPYDGLEKLYFVPGATLSHVSQLSFQPYTSTLNDRIGEKLGNSDGSGIAKIWAQKDNLLGITINGRHYGLFAPKGTIFNRVGGLPGEKWVSALRLKLLGKGYFSMAILPDDLTTTLKAYQRVAYNFPTKMTNQFEVDDALSLVKNSFQVDLEVMESSSSSQIGKTIQALYPHQWEHLPSNQVYAPYTYASARGKMKTLLGNGFQMSIPYRGILPALPLSQVDDPQHLKLLITSEYNRLLQRITKGLRGLEALDSYWNGKELARTAEILHIAHQIGMTKERDLFLQILKEELEDWFTADTGKRYFYYNASWNILLGYPGSYGSTTSFNDLHFHYGYLIKAAAVVAMYDREWAKQENWGGMVNLLIRNVASPMQDDSLFPYLRNFDPYAGHSWAGGLGTADRGNNQESSSEAMSCAAGIILWGEATQQKTYKDLGIYLHSVEAQAINRYWFDKKQQVFPPSFKQSQASIIWSDGGVYATYWTANPDEIHAINYFPITAGHLYLGADTNYVLRNWNNMNANEALAGGCPGLSCYAWPDIQMEWLAFADSQKAMQLYLDEPGYKKESGETKAHTYHWLQNMKQLGSVWSSVYANTALYAVFKKGEQLTYVAYNASPIEKTVTFSDGFSLVVPPMQMGVGKK